MPDKEHHLDLGYSIWGDDEAFSMSPEETTIGIDLVNIGGEAPFSEVKASAEMIPLKEESISSVWAGHVMGHNDPNWTAQYADIDKTLNEIFRVLKPGGKVFIRVSEEDHKYVVQELRKLKFKIVADYHEGEENYIRATKR
tara:strand:- start:426 stop:848 length:423 start_codon:yes stop_codon:yes gene_type:complete